MLFILETLGYFGKYSVERGESVFDLGNNILERLVLGSGPGDVYADIRKNIMAENIDMLLAYIEDLFELHVEIILVVYVTSQANYTNQVH